MALALTVEKNFKDYVLIEHAGETVRIAVHDHPSHNPRMATLILMADDDSGKAPDQGWHLRRKAVRERDDGGA